MTIDKDDLGYFVYCDGKACSNTVTAESVDKTFREAINTAKAEGWKIRKDKHGDWEHICPDCHLEEEEARKERT